jgi:2-methylcitrate dehydratase
VVQYPLGHKRRRAEAVPLLLHKFRTNLARRFRPAQQQTILNASLDRVQLENMKVCDYVDLYVV